MANSSFTVKCVNVPTTQWKNPVRIMTFGFGFCSVLGKTWVLVRFFLAGFGFLSHICFFSCRTTRILKQRSQFSRVSHVAREEILYSSCSWYWDDDDSLKATNHRKHSGAGCACVWVVRSVYRDAICRIWVYAWRTRRRLDLTRPPVTARRCYTGGDFVNNSLVSTLREKTNRRCRGGRLSGRVNSNFKLTR